MVDYISRYSSTAAAFVFFFFARLDQTYTIRPSGCPGWTTLLSEISRLDPFWKVLIYNACGVYLEILDSPSHRVRHGGFGRRNLVVRLEPAQGPAEKPKAWAALVLPRVGGIAGGGYKPSANRSTSNATNSGSSRRSSRLLPQHGAPLWHLVVHLQLDLGAKGELDATNEELDGNHQVEYL